jgi:hypothetical protein
MYLPAFHHNLKWSGLERAKMLYAATEKGLSSPPQYSSQVQAKKEP